MGAWAPSEQSLTRASLEQGPDLGPEALILLHFQPCRKEGFQGERGWWWGLIARTCRVEGVGMGLPFSTDHRESMMLSWAEGRQSLRPILIQGLSPWRGRMGLRDAWQEVHLLASASGGPLWMTNSCPLCSRRRLQGETGQVGWAAFLFRWEICAQCL